MNKVLITGLGIANDLGICESCNLNFSWLVNNLSIVLWVDQLIIPKSSFEKYITQKDKKDELVISMFLNLADKHGLIDKVDFADMY